MGAEAYRRRKRYIYALFFEYQGGCYIGQSVNPKRRAQQHALPSGEWNMSFIMKSLVSGNWTREEAEQMERSYRIKANKKGWKVYGLPHVFINPYRQATMKQRFTAMFLPWPKKWVRRRPIWPWFVAIGALVGVLYVVQLAQ